MVPKHIRRAVPTNKHCSMSALRRSFIYLFLLFHPLMLTSANSKCPQSFRCGNIGTLEFPFSNHTEPECGLFQVNCEHSPPKLQLWPHGVSYEFHERLLAKKLRVGDPDLRELIHGKSCSAVQNQSQSPFPFTSFTILPNLTIFTCWNKFLKREIEDHFKDYQNHTCDVSTFYYRTPPEEEEDTWIPDGCGIVQMPVKPDYLELGGLFQMLTADFEIEYHVSEDCLSCHHWGSKCLSNTNNEFQCEGWSSTIRILTGFVAVTIPICISFLFLFICWKCKLHRVQKATPLSKDIEFFLKNNGNLATLRYRYSDLAKITKSFSEKLGKGGYGSVYKGKLRDGRLVAVKILNESQGNGEEFMNEVASISRTSHVNIVTLLGFCFEGSKRALIYEFMPNGSLEKFIHEPSSSSAEYRLGWEKLCEISVGVARGLEYLHQLCNMRIVHFDIKPHNILLDENFNPKISDFGLAKLCPNRSSIMSMFVARGTIGYIAPEVFCRNFGEVSHKSDVYSYGMMVLEIAGGKKNMEPGNVDHSSELYFPQYIYKQLERMDAGKLDGIIVDEDESQSVKRKLIIVGLWCIQTDSNNRPAMSKVVEMLGGKHEFLEIPPKPYLSSPPRSPLNFSISESIL